MTTVASLLSGSSGKEAGGCWIGAFIVAGVILVASCDRTPVSSAPRLANASATGTSSPSHLDSGAAMLAAVDNARSAIALRNPNAAANDIRQAASYAKTLSGRLSDPIFPEPTTAAGPLGPSVTGAPAGRLTAFQAQVNLTTAQSELRNGNFTEADTGLLAIQNGIPSRLIPIDLPLLRARESLDLARIAVSSGQTPDLRTQLMSAQLALNAYSGPRHAMQAKALAADIGQSLNQRGTLDAISPGQLSVWWGRVYGWG